MNGSIGQNNTDVIVETALLASFNIAIATRIRLRKNINIRSMITSRIAKIIPNASHVDAKRKYEAISKENSRSLEPSVVLRSTLHL
ncbi:unnamed protein product [Schistosoma curassoni]|uniref:40S ribosomal protein S5 n=1 Tax=Schistosoma curassoni TaxID=6186 RepID=A0A183KV04_9TREM|nr:unnamed protein product [Schistosoma curassoni]